MNQSDVATRWCNAEPDQGMKQRSVPEPRSYANGTIPPFEFSAVLAMVALLVLHIR